MFEEYADLLDAPVDAMDIHVQALGLFVTRVRQGDLSWQDYINANLALSRLGPLVAEVWTRFHGGERVEDDGSSTPQST